jgi:acetylornithine deacetylase/succinyl-diaminopimelate desuccinylase-like protein
MTGTQPPSGVSRVLQRLEALFSIGGEPANRPGLSPAEQRAHDLAAGWLAEAGLKVAVDAAGNLVGRALGNSPELPEVWTGSHLDTVPDGGRFDGALGVVAGLEAVIAAHARPHARTIGIVAFRDEEGWRFGQGYFLELHIEQGTSLADRGLALGVVSEIVAMAGLTVRFSGERAHAGGAAMTERRDALVAAADIAMAIETLGRALTNLASGGPGC